MPRETSLFQYCPITGTPDQGAMEALSAMGPYPTLELEVLCKLAPSPITVFVRPEAISQDRESPESWHVAGHIMDTGEGVIATFITARDETGGGYISVGDNAPWLIPSNEPPAAEAPTI